jgi:hypothetical protein
MKMCPLCRVYLPDGTDACPLCRTSLRERADGEEGPFPSSPSGLRHCDETGASPSVGPDGEIKLSPSETRRIAIELVSVSVGIILTVTVGLDYLFSQDLGWSRYTCLALVLVWSFAAFPLIFWGRPALILASAGTMLLLDLLCMALVSGSLGWYLTLGLPIAVAVLAAAAGSWILIAVQKRKGLNSVGVLLAAAVFICSAIDATVGYRLTGILRITWSIIVCISAIPVAALFFWLHYRVTNRASLRKLFRL